MCTDLTTEDTLGRLLMLELQVEELEDQLCAIDKEKQTACKRAAYAENRNKALRKEITILKEYLSDVKRCWHCDNLGRREDCGQCANRVVYDKLEEED